jgi:phosphatidylglycerol---prolipoprotein diacylglyceryl transferase
VYPVLFDFFGYSVSSFGALVAVGVLLGTYVGAGIFEESGSTREMAWSLAIWGLVGGLIGAKLWFLGERWVRAPEQFDLVAFTFGPGGLTWYGGFAGGFVALTLAVRHYGISLWNVLNLCSIPALIAQSLGRIGCFFVGDDYGRASDVPWAMAFPDGAPPTVERVHPTMLYESAWLALAAWILWQRRRTSPCLFAEYLMLAGVGRFCNELLRVNPPLLGPFSNAQLIAVASFSVGVGLWLWSRPRAEQMATSGPL